MYALCDRMIRTSECITNEIQVPGEKLHVILVCVMPLMVPTLRSTERIRNCVRYSVWKCIDFSYELHGWRYRMFYFIVI